MSDTTGTQTNSGSEGDQTGAGSAGTSGDGAAGGTDATTGTATADLSSDLSKAQETIRTLQSEKDRLRNELDTARSAAAASSEAGDGAGSSGNFDPEAFERSLLTKVYGASALSAAVTAIQQEFPHADPAIFAADSLAGFGSPDALRLAAQQSHLRVASVLEREKAAIEERVRAELASKVNPAGEGASGGTNTGGNGDPTPAQLSRMTMDELDALEKSNPGVLDRVIRSAMK